MTSVFFNDFKKTFGLLFSLVLIMTLAFWGLRGLSLYTTSAQLAYERVKDGFETGALYSNNYPWGSWNYSRDSFMDCSMFNQIFADESFLKSEKAWHALFVNNTFLESTPSKRIPGLKMGCEIYGSVDGVAQVPSLEELLNWPIQNYDRYWWGVKDILRLALGFFDFTAIKAGILGLNLLSLLIWVVSLAALKLSEASQSTQAQYSLSIPRASQSRLLWVCVILLAFIPLAFSGLPFFWRSWVHLPSWFLPFGIVGLLNLIYRRSNHLPLWAFVVLGGFCAYLEGLNGPLPLTLATLLASQQIRCIRAWDFDYPRIVQKVFAFLAAFGLSVMVKILASTLIRPEALKDFFHQLLYRTSTEGERFSHAWRALTAPQSVDALAWGHTIGTWVPLLVPTLGAVLLGVLVWNCLRGPHPVRLIREFLRANLIPCFLIAFFFLWILVLRNHTAFHGFFMNRLFQIPLMSLVLLLYGALEMGSNAKAWRP